MKFLFPFRSTDFEDIPGSGGTEEQELDPQGGSEESSQGGQSIPEEFLKNYEGKTSEELIKEIYKSQQQIGKQAQTIGKIKQEKSKPKLDDIKKEYLTTQKEYERLQKELTEKDPYVDDDYNDLSTRLKELENKKDSLYINMIDLKTENTIMKVTAERNNRELTEKMSKDYKEQYGLELNWDEIKNEASRIAKVDNRLEISPEDFESAIIRKLGLANYKALLSSNIEYETRNKIAEATGRMDIMLEGGKPTKAVNLDSMSYAQREIALSKMSKEELEREMKKRGLL